MSAAAEAALDEATLRADSAPVQPPATVAVAGATGWLGGHVVAELLSRGYSVLVLARASADVNSLVGPLVSVARCDVTHDESLATALDGSGAAAVISCVGMRDLAVPDAEIFRVLRNGTAHLYKAALACGARRFIIVAGGIHRNPDGTINTEMAHNAARETGISQTDSHTLAAERATATVPAIVAVDPSVFFKDAETIFNMIAASRNTSKPGEASLTLVSGSWEVRINPISGRDLATRLADCLISPIPASGRITAGGPDTYTFAEFVDLAGQALGVRVHHRSLPRPLARALLLVARLGGALGRRKALAAQRLLSFLWVVGTDRSPGRLVGTTGGQDRVTELFVRLAAEKRQGAAVSGSDRGDR
ncbi:hypothetical protein JKP88DRAFT_324166 [Tribonema minus]|uniref:NAD(P)-binding domain-containing protein n=1 Tax=Tribonema minus TaxID=303371 RepID=A0A836CC80_9STRA|nr:hypothetical protein JKP88DRAFT_324166 [Tribonema minus]